MDWAAVGVLAGLIVASFGYLARQIEGVERRLHDEIVELRTDFNTRFATLEERYVRHLEQHAAGNA